VAVRYGIPSIFQPVYFSFDVSPKRLKASIDFANIVDFAPESDEVVDESNSGLCICWSIKYYASWLSRIDP
jgi:hypothetical protein